MERGKHQGTTDSPPTDFGAVCRNVRAALEPARVHAVSLHDEKGDLLWLTESAMGPDEHNAVRDAFDAFSNAAAPPIVAYDLGDSRSAVLLRVANGQRAMVGAIMVVVDTRSINARDNGAARLMSPKLQAVIAEFADLTPQARAAPVGSAPRPAPAPAAKPAAHVVAAPPVAARPVAARPVAAHLSAPVAKSPAVAGHLSSAQVPKSPAVPPEIDRLHGALRRSPIALHVQRLVPLTKGTQLKRYEVLLRSKSDDAPDVAPHAMLKAAVDHGLGSMIDRRVVTELIGWLVHHPDVWQKNAVLFSVNLTTTALIDEHFIKFVELCLAKSSLPKAMVGFEIDVPTALKIGPRITEVAAALHRLGCPLVLDDFGMRTECFALLRLPAVRYVKLASELTSTMRSDKLSQAAITAVVQMARVLGMHTVAKRTETAAEQEWLTALGVDFIQSNALSPSVALETLSKSQKPPPRALTR